MKLAWLGLSVGFRHGDAVGEASALVYVVGSVVDGDAYLNGPWVVLALLWIFIVPSEDQSQVHAVLQQNQ